MGSLFVRPEVGAFAANPTAFYYQNYLTYSHYNYLRPGLIAKVKRKRLEVALEMARPWFARTAAVDIGCADGIMLPSLARYFTHVAAVDLDPEYLQLARNLVAGLGLQNVETVCNRGMSFQDLKHRLSGREYGVGLLLETLEHIGRSPETMYQDKLEFLDQCFSLLRPDGMIVISVPKMVGITFLVKYAVQASLRMHKEPVSWREGVRAGLFKDASLLEPRWAGGHVGFDDMKLGRLLSQKYEVVGRRSLAATVMWAVTRRAGDAGRSDSVRT
jgi:2-polyprenyl-3-methyl-5-hydroxy-6-metoxy-1,4-benzoquinol methylase